MSPAPAGRSAGSASGERRAWGWVAHLRHGGTTRWRDWATEAEPGGLVLPGVQQLELLRRVNTVQVPRPESRLVERILSASAPGRGRPDLELLGVAEESRFGPPPVRPSDLPDDELIRVASGLLAEDLVATGVPVANRTAFARPWRTRYRVVGDPWLADPIRAELIARGHPPGGRGAVVLVLGTDLGSMLTDAWMTRAFAEGGPSWGVYLDARIGARSMPRRIDLVEAARAWSLRVGASRVRIVLDPGGVPSLVGVRRPLGVPPVLSADAVDLARRVGAALGLIVVPRRRGALLRATLRPRLEGAPGDPLVVPREHEPWLRRRAERMRDDLLAAGYAVHGDPNALLPRSRDGAVEPSDAGILALAIGLLVDQTAYETTSERRVQRGTEEVGTDR